MSDDLLVRSEFIKASCRCVLDTVGGSWGLLLAQNILMLDILHDALFSWTVHAEVFAEFPGTF